MPIVVDAVEARNRRTAVEVKGYTQTVREEDQYFATLYMGAPPATAAHALGEGIDKSLPQAYLVEQPAGATVPPHFHDTDQFQVFVEGVAAFGKQVLRPVSVHYAGGHTPYGPIVTTERGTHYFTLRANWDSGGKPMPASRDKLQRGRACHRLAENLHDLDARGGTEVLPVEDSGLGAMLYELAPNDTQVLDLAREGGGQYALVTRGSVCYDHSTLVERSCLYRAADEVPLSLTGGAEGGTVLLMQFPKSGH